MFLSVRKKKYIFQLDLYELIAILLNIKQNYYENRNII